MIPPVARVRFESDVDLLDVLLAREEPGYYLGDVECGGVSFHVEACKAGTARFKRQVAAHMDRNDGAKPQLVKIPGLSGYWYVGVEVFSQ